MRDFASVRFWIVGTLVVLLLFFPGFLAIHLGDSLVFRLILFPLALVALFGGMLIWVGATNRGRPLVAGKEDFSRGERALLVGLGLLLVAPLLVVLGLIYH